MEIREDKIRPHRIAKLDKMFHENDFVTAKKIMTTFEVCKRTVQRDIEFLRDRYDAPIGYKKNKGYYYTDKTFFEGRGIVCYNINPTFDGTI